MDQKICTNINGELQFNSNDELMKGSNGNEYTEKISNGSNSTALTNGVGDDLLQGGIENRAWLRVIQLGSITSIPMTLKAVLNLGVMDILLKSEKELADQNTATMLSAEEIVAKMEPSVKESKRVATSLDRLLRYLGSHDVFSQEMAADGITRKYGLNDVSRLMAGQPSLAPMVLMHQHNVLLDTWHYLQDSVVDGGDPFAKAHGGLESFEYVRLHEPGFDALFNKAMAEHSSGLLAAFLGSSYAARVFDDGSFRSLVDVGGGVGSALETIVAKFPHIKPAINFDQPHVVQLAPSMPGIEHVGGDMFESIPSTDAIFMKWILHDWSDKHCLKILENCYKALPQSGKIIVLDAIVPTNVDNSLRAQLAYQLDILMFAYNPGGRERTQQEFENLIKQVGFSRLEVICKLNEFSVIEIYKS